MHGSRAGNEREPIRTAHSCEEKKKCERQEPNETDDPLNKSLSLVTLLHVLPRRAAGNCAKETYRKLLKPNCTRHYMRVSK